MKLPTFGVKSLLPTHFLSPTCTSNFRNPNLDDFLLCPPNTPVRRPPGLVAGTVKNVFTSAREDFFSFLQGKDHSQVKYPCPVRKQLPWYLYSSTRVPVL